MGRFRNCVRLQREAVSQSHYPRFKSKAVESRAQRVMSGCGFVGIDEAIDTGCDGRGSGGKGGEEEEEEEEKEEGFGRNGRNAESGCFWGQRLTDAFSPLSVCLPLSPLQVP